jgi:DNA-binding NarL/FixJ family response regulator
MGNKNTQIAFQMGISTATVKSYLQNIFNKIGVRSKTELRLKFVNFDFEKYTPYR